MIHAKEILRVSNRRDICLNIMCIVKIVVVKNLQTALHVFLDNLKTKNDTIIGMMLY
jgi:hypothetical protein